jgi:hypothetical protein
MKVADLSCPVSVCLYCHDDALSAPARGGASRFLTAVLNAHIRDAVVKLVLVLPTTSTRPSWHMRTALCSRQLLVQSVLCFGQTQFVATAMSSLPL